MVPTILVHRCWKESRNSFGQPMISTNRQQLAILFKGGPFQAEPMNIWLAPASRAVDPVESLLNQLTNAVSTGN